MKSDFIKTLSQRGYIKDCTDTDGLDELASKQSITGYIGFDATADSLHVGSLMGIMMLRRMQQAGHRPIVLMGGGTTKVGDPSGKTETRKMLTDDMIEENIAKIKTIFEQFLDFDAPDTGAIMVNNDDWLAGLEYIPFLREVGRHFSINRMLSMESVKLRLEREQTLSFLEFNYMILQSYDFVELFQRHGCQLQMGGSDQWGNIVCGVELGRRMAEGKKEVPLFGLTCDLIMTASGEKMGKTVSGAVWLNEDRLSAYDYWQFWRNTEDADVGRFMRLFTDLPLEEIERLEKLEGAEINEAKKILADEATKLCRGIDAAKQARQTAEEAFEQGNKAEGLPTIELPTDALGRPVIELFKEAGLAASNGEARRLVRQGGAKLNDEKLSDENALFAQEMLDDSGVLKLSAGKKRHALVRLV